MTRSIMLASLAGLACAPGALAGVGQTVDPPAIGREVFAGPRNLAGHLYLKPATGEMVFTPAAEYLAARARAGRSFGDDINADGTPDYWVNTNLDPCGIGTPSNPNVDVGVLDTPTTQGDYHHYKCVLGPTDVFVETLAFMYFTDVVDTDTDSDTVPDANTAGHGLAITFWDREDVFGAGSCNCTFAAGGPGFLREQIVTYNFTNLPGPLTAPPPGGLAGFSVFVDLSGGNEFELADSNGNGPASGYFNPFIATDQNGDTLPDADTNADGTMDFAVTYQGIQPNDGRLATIGYALAAPGADGHPYQLDWDRVNPSNDGDVVPNGAHRLDQGQPLGTAWDMTRLDTTSAPAPVARPRFTSTADIDANANTANFSFVSRYSIFTAAYGQTPFPGQGSGWLPCAGQPSSDFFGWGSTSSIDGAFYGGLNCLIDDDQDGSIDGRPWSGPYLALGGSRPTDYGCNGCGDCDNNGVLNLDDINLFAQYFVAGDLLADMEGNGVLNLDDVNFFAAAFISGCP
ncbi:MAG: GC-type dockerin domain-anchored protein [Phycisphaerales bacterium]